MTAQGGDLLAWLDNAISERERMAQESVEQATVNLAGAEASSVSVWRVIERPATGTFVATCDQWDRVAEVVPTYGGAHAEHIAANDPASVLRRCAADRKMLELHSPVVLRGGGGARYFETTTVCKSCEPPVQFPEHAFPCPTVLAIAEGYGWTEGEQTLCGYTKRHPSHTFMRMEVLFLCPGVEDLACPCGSGSPEMYEGPLRDCPIHGERGTEGER